MPAKERRIGPNGKNGAGFGLGKAKCSRPAVEIHVVFSDQALQFSNSVASRYFYE